MYYPIKEWQKAGLKKRSYVDTHKTYNLPETMVFSRKPIGKLEDEDVVNLLVNGKTVEKLAKKFIVKK